MDKVTTIMLSAGGTGGHLFPAESLAQMLLQRGYRVVIVTDKRGKAFQNLGEGVVIKTVPAGTVQGGVKNTLLSIFKMGVGTLKGLYLVLRYRPAVTVGFGGYPSFPAVFAAQLLLRRTMLHEQNAVLGKANMWLSYRADRVALSHPQTRGLRAPVKKRSVVTGNPVRADIAALYDGGYPSMEETITILVTGGSQGARILSTVVPAAIVNLPPVLKARLRVVHQARPEDIDTVKETYVQGQVQADVSSFFADMAGCLAACHLFIGRSGASTVSEIAVAGRPALFVPLRHGDMQQKHNAQDLVDHGAAWLILQENFTENTLLEKLRTVLENPDMLATAAIAAKQCAVPDGARRLADLVEQRIENNG